MPPHRCQPGATTILAEEEGAELWASPPSQQGWAEGLPAPLLVVLWGGQGTSR